MGKAEWGGNPVCWLLGLYFCFVCCLDKVSCTSATGGCVIPGLVFKWFPLCEFSLFDTPYGYFSGNLGSWSQCSHSKGSGFDLFLLQALQGAWGKLCPETPANNIKYWDRLSFSKSVQCLRLWDISRTCLQQVLEQYLTMCGREWAGYGGLLHSRAEIKGSCFNHPPDDSDAC